MRTFSVTNRLGAIAVIAAAAIALAACGGGGGLNEDEAAGLRDEVKAAEAAQAAAEAARAAAEAAQTAAEAEAAAAEAAQAAAEAAQEAAEAEAAQQVADAKAAQAAAEAAQAQAEADKAAAEARSAEEVAAANRLAEQARIDKEAAEADATRAREARDTALAAQTTAERDKAAAERELATAQEQLRAAQQAEQTARAEAEEAQLRAEEQQEQLQQQLTEAQQVELRARASSFGAVLDLGDGGESERGSATVTWPRGGSLTFRPEGAILAADSAAPAVSGSWRRGRFTGQTGTASTLIDNTVYLYTNIQAPGTRAFWKVHGLTATMSETGLAALARGSSASPTRDTDNNANYTALTVSGSLSGASGRFHCSGCTGTVADGYDSHVTFSQGVPAFAETGSWVFTPSSITNSYRVNQDDAFLYFGIWSSIPVNIGGAYDFKYVSGGGHESGSALGRFDNLTGSATFRGGAVGRYVTQGQVGQQNAKIGTFTATAELNADFGTDGAGGTLSGRITDFREGGNPLTGWQVTLGSADNVGQASTITSAAATGSTVASIGGVAVGGSWGATFHGSDNDGVAELTDTARYPATRYPQVDLAGVTGWFDAAPPNCPNACLAGAFAAIPSR